MAQLERRGECQAGREIWEMPGEQILNLEILTSFSELGVLPHTALLPGTGCDPPKLAASCLQRRMSISVGLTPILSQQCPLEDGT